MNNAKQKNTIITILITVVLLLLTKVILGFYYGWFDEIVLMNLHNGLGYNQPLTNHLNTHVRYFLFIADIIVYLNNKLPPFNWYGIFIYSLASISIFISIKSIYTDIKDNFSISISLLFIALFYFVFLVEMTFQLNFTTVAVFLVGIGLSKIFENPNKKFTYYLPFLLIFTTGLLIRYEISAITIPLFMALILFKKDYNNRKNILVTIVMLMIAPYAYELHESNHSKDVDKETVKTFQKILDFKDYHSNYNFFELDKARSTALFTWYSGDDKTLLSEEYINKLNVESSFNTLKIKDIRNRIRTQFDTISKSYSKEYFPTRNWHIKLIISSLIITLLFIYILNSNIKTKYIPLVTIFYFTIHFIVLLIFFKLEYRVHYPVFLITLLVILKSSKVLWKKENMKYAILILIILSFLRVYEYKSTLKFAKEEQLKKENFYTELFDKFENKKIFLDLYTYSLFPHKGFINIKKPSSNIFLVYGEGFSNQHQFHLDYLTSLCGSNEIVAFFNCMFEDRENVVFIFSKIRVEMYELYFKDIYNIDFKFKKLDQGRKNALNSITHTFVGPPINMDYYIFDRFEKK